MPRLPRSDTIGKSQTGIERLPARGISSVKLVEGINIFKISNNDVSSPPTSAEITSALGTASILNDGMTGIIDDAGAGVTVWLCVAKNQGWWYEQLTKAV